MPDAELEAFRAKFRLAELEVASDGDWLLSVRPAQPVLGAAVISHRRGAERFGEVSEDAGAGLLRLAARAERYAIDQLGAVRINLLCLMMQDPIVHFHLLPRFSGPVEAFGRTWVDAGWPGPPDLSAIPGIDDPILQAIRDGYVSSSS